MRAAARRRARGSGGSGAGASAGASLLEFDRTFGSRLLAGADEAGRGCLAGPLVAAAVLLDCERLAAAPLGELAALDDSKRHTARSRERLLPLILRSAVRVSVVSRSAASIDRAGLHRTNLSALRDALRSVVDGALEQPVCLVDGFQLDGLAPPHTALVGGDGRSAAIAAASIVAKVTRDRAMAHAEAAHPGWGFARHVGYATAEHRSAIERLGVSPLHRMSFRSSAYSG